MAAADKQLIVAVEGTAALGFYWPFIVSEYIEKIVRSFCGTEIPGQKPAASTGSGSTFELGLVMFNAHGPYSGFVVQRSSWTKDVNSFLGWLSSLTFSGGGLENAAIAEGLSEALMMFAIPQNGYQTQQNAEGKKHCILVAASNPYPLPTPVYRPQIDNTEQGKNIEEQTESRLYDAETVAQWFGHCSVSLSVICPKQLQKLRAIYSAGKHNARATDPQVDVKQPHFLVLMADSFMEARGALSRTGLVTNQSIITSLPPSSVPASAAPSVNQPILNRPPVAVGSIPQATVKVEPTTVTSMVSGPSMSHMPSVPRAASQVVPSLQASSPPPISQEMITSNDAPEVKPMVSSMSQSLRPVGAILNNLSQARVMSSAALTGNTSLGLPSMGGNPIGIHMSNMISGGVTSSVPPAQTMLSSGQPGITSTSVSGTMTGTSQPMQNNALNAFTSATPIVSGSTNLPTSQPPSNLQAAVSMGQSVSGMSQGSMPQMAQSGTGINPNVMNNISSTGTGTGTSTATGTGTMIPTPGMSSQVQPGSAQQVQTGMSQQVQPGISQQVQQGMSQQVQPGMSQQVQPGMSQQVQPGMPQQVQQGMPQHVQAGMQQQVQPGMPQQVQPGMQQQVQPGIPQQVQPGMSQQVPPGMQNVVMSNNSATNMPMSQQASSLQSAQSKYVRVWEGSLSGQRQGQPVLITRLEGYRNASASETLAANWPPTMQIVRLISQDHMNNKQYVGKADFLVFRAMNQHGFLQQLQEKKLCAVIQLPSQTLLLSVSDKACRLIGMLFPGDMVVFKPQNPTPQQQQQLQNQQLQQQQQMQNQQLQQQQQRQLQQQMPQHQQQQSLQHMQQQPQQLPQLQQQPTLLQQQQQQQQQPIPQLQQQQQPIPQQLQLQQQQQQSQQMMGGGLGQPYVQGLTRPQLVQQGQVPSQVQQNMPGGGFMG